MTRARSASAVLAAALGLGGLTGCSAAAGPPAEAPASTLIKLSFNDSPASGELGGNLGVLDVSTSVVAVNQGTIQRVVDRNGGHALRFPSFDSSDSAARAVLRVTASTGSDDLSPASSTFVFGASFRLDALSQGSGTDNGDNVVQVGRYGDDAQYKLDVDERSPICRVKGDQGAVEVKATMHVNARDWYRAECRRDDSTVTLSVVQHLADHKVRSWSMSATGSIGSVIVPGGTSMSVGGKLDADGRIADSSDQFNGAIDDVVLRVSE